MKWIFFPRLETAYLDVISPLTYICLGNYQLSAVSNLPTILWEQIGGGPVSISDPTSYTPTISPGASVGPFIFRVTAGAGTNNEIVKIVTVYSAPTENATNSGALLTKSNYSAELNNYRVNVGECNTAFEITENGLVNITWLPGEDAEYITSYQVFDSLDGALVEVVETTNTFFEGIVGHRYKIKVNYNKNGAIGSYITIPFSINATNKTIYADECTSNSGASTINSIFNRQIFTTQSLDTLEDIGFSGAYTIGGSTFNRQIFTAISLNFPSESIGYSGSAISHNYTFTRTDLSGTTVG